ncbi:hypothetical protein JCM10213v2_004499 [Rhodosporidiobolus nylandii]
MSSDDDVDSFFTHDTSRILASTSRPRKRRKSSHSPAANDSDSSSDLEVLDQAGTKAQAAARTKKGKGKEVAVAPRPKSAAASKTGGGRKGKANEISLSSSDDSDAGSHAGPSSTQLEEGGDVLRTMARNAGWQGSTPERRTKQREEKAAEERRRQRELDKQQRALYASSDSEQDEDSPRSRRRTSTSTAQTSLSSSSATKAKQAPAAKKAAAKPKKASSSTSARRKRAATPEERSPSPQLQPPPPQSFWGVADQPPPAQPKKRTHGEASKKLKTLSERQGMLVLPDEDDPDEIAGSSSDGEAGPRKYESVAAKHKRERAEAHARLQAKRNGSKLPLQNAPNGVTPVPSPKSKDKGARPATTVCNVCSARVARSDLQTHEATCMGGVLDLSDSQLDFDSPAAGPAPPRPIPSRPAAAPRPGASTSASAFRPAGTRAAPAASTSSSRQLPPRPAAAAAPPARQGDPLVAELFPSSSPPIARRSAPKPPPPDKGKGKSRATLVDDTDDESGSAPAAGPSRAAPALDGRLHGARAAPSAAQDIDDLEGFFDEDGLDEDGELWEDPAGFAALEKNVVVIDDDDDEPVVMSGASRGAAAAGGKGKMRGIEGAVNKERRPGPPANGSSPPRDSIYVSTMSTAFRTGYEKMYTKARRRGGGGGEDDGLDGADADAFDAAFQPASKLGRGRDDP